MIEFLIQNLEKQLEDVQTDFSPIHDHVFLYINRIELTLVKLKSAC